MRALMKKAGSRRGASITFALLLFLVCAVISAVVIVAATAVGGRASKMAEMDQRYYAVNSAAELLRDELEKPTVTVTTKTITTSTVDQDDLPLASPAPTTTVPPAEVSMIYEDPAPIDLSGDTSSLVSTAARTLASTDATLPTSLSLTARGASDSLEIPALAVTIDQIGIDSDNKKLSLDVYNTSETAKGTYKLRLTFKADSTASNGTHTAYGPKNPTRDPSSGKVIEGKYTRVKTEEMTTTTTVHWKLIDLVVAPAATNAPAATTNPGG